MRKSFPVPDLQPRRGHPVQRSERFVATQAVTLQGPGPAATSCVQLSPSSLSMPDPELKLHGLEPSRTFPVPRPTPTAAPDLRHRSSFPWCDNWPGIGAAGTPRLEPAHPASPWPFEDPLRTRSRIRRRFRPRHCRASLLSQACDLRTGLGPRPHLKAAARGLRHLAVVCEL